MNALLWTPSKLDDAVLWLCVLHAPQTLSRVARGLGKKVGSLSQNVQKLKSRGYLDRSHGSMVPYPIAIERVRWLQQHGYQQPQIPGPSQAPTAGSDSARQEAEPVARVVVDSSAMETRVSIGRSQEPTVDALIDALAGFQDQLLQASNAQLRLRVTELEAEVAMLRDRSARVLELMAKAADALTG